MSARYQKALRKMARTLTEGSPQTRLMKDARTGSARHHKSSTDAAVKGLKKMYKRHEWRHLAAIDAATSKETDHVEKV